MERREAYRTWLVAIEWKLLDMKQDLEPLATQLGCPAS
jgi:hypothetical protein